MKPKLFIGKACDELDNSVGFGNDLDFDNDTLSNTHAVIHFVERGGFTLQVIRTHRIFEDVRSIQISGIN